MDSSTRTGSVALLGGEDVLAESAMRVSGAHAEHLIPEIDRLMKASGLTLGDLDALAVGLGPGSLTGTRVGLSIAKGLALGTGLPVVGVSSLDAIARSTALTGLQACPMINAGKGDVFTALYGLSDEGELEKRTEDLALTPSSLVERIVEPTIFAGGGALMYRGFLTDRLGDVAIFAPPDQRLPRAAVIARLAVERLREGAEENPGGLRPNYIRKSEAEIQWARKHGEQACSDHLQGALGKEECK